MTQRYLQFATATAVACVTATVLAAQAPSPRAEDGRDVTAVGCLKQERDIHGRLTTGAAGESARSGGEAFVLVNARITGASITDARPAADDPTTPGSTTASAAAKERERRSSPSGAPGVSGAGTSGTENTSVQSTDRPASEAAQGGATGSNPAGRGPDTMYKIVGLPDSQLTPLLNKQVEVRATLDANTMGSAALRQPGVTMGRDPASTPSSSTPPPEPTQAPASQSDRQADRQDTTPAASASLPELKATSIKATGGRCQGT
jgi:hypothetical protein